jgi:hypothetical protein
LKTTAADAVAAQAEAVAAHAESDAALAKSELDNIKLEIMYGTVKSENDELKKAAFGQLKASKGDLHQPDSKLQISDVPLAMGASANSEKSRAKVDRRNSKKSD